jgi:hypothetical protein
MGNLKLRNGEKILSNQLFNSRKTWADGLTALIVLVAVFAILGLFAWWAFTWTTHTLVWFIFIFGSVLGSVKVRASK